MYMLVFVTLIVAVIGGYAQMYTAMVSRMMSQQSGVADAMFQWQATAVGLASSLVTKTNLTAAGCSLTKNTTGNASFASCTYNAINQVYVGVSAGGTLPVACTGGQSPPCVMSLPTGYVPYTASNPYAFYSVAFTASSNYYVLTYVPPPPAASDKYNQSFVCLPGNAAAATACAGAAPGGANSTQIPTTMAGLSKQIGKNMNIVPIAYGTVTSVGTLTTPTASFNFGAGPTLTSRTYAIPLTNIPVGSIGLITQIAPCSVC